MTLMHTELTQRFGLRLPVLAGGLMWLADADYVAAAAHAGALGFLTAASFPEDAQLRAEIARAQELCQGKPFGVNVSMLPKLVPGERTEQVFRIAAEMGVEVVETSGRNPEPYLPLLRELGLVVIHKVPAVRYAIKAQQVGVDMVSIVGAECGGHPGMDMIGSFVNAAMAGRDLDIPFMIGGGVGHGAQIVSALAMGAAGVVMGTRLLVAQELNAHPDYKRAIAEASERDTVLTMSSVRNTVRTLANETTEAVTRMETDNPNVTIADLMPLVSGQIGRKAYETGDVSRGLLSAGHALGLTSAVQPMAEIFDQLEQEACQALARIDALRAPLTEVA
ncbi:Nitronate monooxygenase [Pelagimonas phthalicica]|uniref:Nitronate monooxygenase n=1 Tax=Pelagimonas phthalicica TaxID=1037362 RepID=A0A238JB69_9RHOB|nr:nitronate monooxygenase [Pelagimonas phthalicica]TDS93853.1 nitronate monooxygenase [Pelagimonas phthalicica]SMX27623.1 Nitronate monooxygenase [Pelagimonas phthalicica]